MKAMHIFCLLIFPLLDLIGFESFSQQPVFTPVPQPKTGATSHAATRDPKGYMWFGGIGVHRYDGYNYKSYFNDHLDTSSLAFNLIESMYADSTGNIWVGTNGGGLDRLDPETGIFTHFRHKHANPNSLSSDTITVILEDREGKIWAGTESAGLNCLDPKTGTVTRFRHDPNDATSLSNDQVRALYEDHKGTLWVGTGFPYTGDPKWKEGGLNRFNPADKNFTRFVHDPKDPSSLIDNRVRTIFEDSKGRFWVGTGGDGLHIMNREKGTFERHPYSASNPNGLSRPPVKNNVGWLDDLITFIREDAAGKLWIGTFSGGLNRYDPETGKISYYTSPKEKSTDKNEVSTFWWSCISKDGLLWIGSLNDGMYRLDPFHKQIPQYDAGSHVSSLLQDASGNLWLGTDKGLIVYDSASGSKKEFDYDASDTMGLNFNGVSTMFEDRMGTVWIGTNHLISYNHQSKKFKRYPINGFITVIYEDSEGLLWIGAGEDGLARMNRKADTITWYRPSKTDTISLSESTPTCIREDREGYLWIGTRLGGLNRFDKKNNRFQHYLPGTLIQNIFLDADDTLWVGTNRGLYSFNPSSNSFILFSNLGAGLTKSISVYHILEDDQRSLWINTNNGLFRIRHTQREINFFGNWNGVIPSRWNYQNSCFKGKGGKLFFSDITGNGYYAFFPEQLTGNTTAPELYITGFRLGDQLISPGKGSPLSLPVSQTKEIRLPYNQNVFSFDFAGIHFSNPEANRHLFMLENLDNDWRKAGEEKTAYYYNVPPGHYLFRVKASSSDGVWAEKSIDIIISPPWWKTWWAYVVYGLLFIAAVWRIHRYQKQRVIDVEREKAQKRELAQAKEIEKAYHELKTTQQQLIQSEKMASLGELTAGIAHEIQNPLNFVNNFSEVSGELISELVDKVDKGNTEGIKAIAQDVQQNLEKIVHHGKRADAIVKGMLQHSRSGSGVKEPTDINALADEYLRLCFHGLRARDKGFNASIKTDFDPGAGTINIVSQDIGRVILNLLTNAFYAVVERKKRNEPGYEPTVTLSTKRTAGDLEICVKDNGMGIDQQALDKIFQPFFTTKPTGQGTGLGLSLAYDIVKAHGGELRVETKEGEGAEFIIELPIK